MTFLRRVDDLSESDTQTSCPSLIHIRTQAECVRCFCTPFVTQFWRDSFLFRPFHCPLPDCTARQVKTFAVSFYCFAAAYQSCMFDPY